MSYIINETMVVSGWNAERVLKAHTAALSIFEKRGIARLVSGLTQHITNGGAAFFISPDGSKEGWGPSDTAAEARADFIKWLRERASGGLSFDWALIVLGGDDGEFVVADSPASVSDTAMLEGQR